LGHLLFVKNERIQLGTTTYKTAQSGNVNCFFRVSEFFQAGEKVKEGFFLSCSHAIVSWIVFNFSQSQRFEDWRDVVCESAA
jgi:hypothetical protein